MQILEDRIAFGAGELVDAVGRQLGLGRRRLRPRRQQRGGEIGDRRADRLGEVPARGRILLLLDRAHAKHQPRDAIGLVDLQHAFGELDGFVDLAIGEHRQEGAAEQLAVAGIAPQRGSVVGGGRGRVTLPERVAGGEIAARRRHPRKIRWCLGLCPRQQHAWPGNGAGGENGDGSPPEAWRWDHGLDSSWRKRALGAAALTGREWPFWARPAITAPTGHVHRL